jgi:cytochrome c
MIKAEMKPCHSAARVRMGRLMFLAAGALAFCLPGTVSAQSCTDITASDFKKVPLATGLESPLKMNIAADGRIFFIERSGAVMLLKPGSGTPIKLLGIAVADGTQNEDGVLGIALDPHFASNNWIYIYHTLANPMGYRISRYTLVGDALDAASEKVVMKWNHLFTGYGNLIIHGAGAIAFDPAGNLLISTGDLSHTTDGPTQSPVVENSSNGVYDAQRTSSNTNSYFGKILRITPKDDGTYSVPAGNLFAAGTAQTLPEIYAMGVRNPFTLTIDPKTGWAYSGEVGPDGSDGAIPSQDEVNQIKAAGNFGWPYLTGDNQAYADVNGAKFNPAALVNNSKNNTGMKTLPDPVKSLFWYGYNKSWPIDGVKPNSGNRCIKVGAFYRYNPAGTNPKRLPPAMDNGFFMANHNDNEVLRFFKLDDAGALTSIKTVISGLGRPISAEVGPDGALYVMEWGGDNGHWFNQKNGILSRVDYTGSCSTTSLAPRFLGSAFKGRSMAALTPGAQIPYPDWATHVSLYDLKGVKRFSAAVGQSGNGLKATVPADLPAGLMYVDYRKD